jgi:hypothetical protein
MPEKVRFRRLMSPPRDDQALIRGLTAMAFREDPLRINSLEALHDLAIMTSHRGCVLINSFPWINGMRDDSSSRMKENGGKAMSGCEVHELSVPASNTRDSLQCDTCNILGV